jgi:hypothetical protein
LAVAAWAVEPGRIIAPGITGMNTDADPVDLRPTDARYLLNINAADFPGEYHSRYGHLEFDSNATAMTAAVPLYDELTKWKAIIGFTPGASIEVGIFQTVNADSSLNTIDSTITLNSGTDTTVATPKSTAKNRATLLNDIDLWWSNYGTYYDVTTGGGMGSIVATPGMPAGIASTTSPYAVTDSVLDTVIGFADTLIDTTIIRRGWPYPDSTVIDTLISITDSVASYFVVTRLDTLSFLPRVVPLSPPPPGAPMVFGLSTGDGNLTGAFRYRVRFRPYVTGLALYEDFVYSAYDVGVRLQGRYGPPSNIVSVTNGSVVLTAFPRSSGNYRARPDTTVLTIYREEVDQGTGWRLLDSIAFDNSDTVIYWDNTGGLPPADTLDPAYETYYANAAGVVGIEKLYAEAIDTTEGWGAGYYWIAYSVLDTILGIESALGPKRRFYADTATNDDSTYTVLLNIPVVGPWNAVRVYRTITDSSVIGYDDSSIVWCVDQLPVRTDQHYVEVQYQLGTHHDVELDDTSGVIDLSTGNTLQRPPYLSHLSYTPSDIALWDERLWGIGDPEFPSRLYFSGDGLYEDWLATNSYDLDPDDNDMLVAIEPISIGTADALLAFKRRKTFLITGESLSDIEFLDGRLWTGYSGAGSLDIALLTASVGAISRDLVLARGDAVFVVTNDLHCVRFHGTRPDTISNGVLVEMKQTITDTTLYNPGGGKHYRQRTTTSYSPADVHAVMMSKGDNILILNQYNYMGMAWNVKTRQWSKVQYMFADVPAGTIKYDTVSSPDLFGDDNDLFFFDNAGLPFYVENDTVYTDTLNTDTTNGYYSVMYRSPTFTDPGWWLWMRSLDLSFSSAGPSVIVTVFNSTGDSLAARLFTSTDVDDLSDITIGLPRHAATGLVVQIQADSAGGRFILYEFTPDIVRLGQYQRK